ncbi:MAG: TonB-dependent receptor [Alicyclobacillus sp.]|nr:TonB-dependent receptor [Alicyclobacillus sp.]
MRPFLKWAGNKYRIVDKIKAVLPEGRRLVEPFAGSAAVFMNTDYAEVYGDYGDGYGAFYASPFDDAGETMLQREFYVNREKSKGFNTDNSLAARFDTGPFQHTVLAGVDYFKFKQNKDEGFSCDGFAGQFGCFNGPSPPSLNIHNPQYGTPFAWGYTNFLDYESSQVGLYVQDQIRFADRVSIVLGARRDRAPPPHGCARRRARSQSHARGAPLAQPEAPDARLGRSARLSAGARPRGDARPGPARAALRAARSRCRQAAGANWRDVPRMVPVGTFECHSPRERCSGAGD